MIPLLIAILLGLTSPAQSNTTVLPDGTVITTNDTGTGDEGDDTGGENGPIKPPITNQD